MRKFKWVLAVAVVVAMALAFSACTKKQPATGKEYFPLEMGDQWTYNSTIGGTTEMEMVFKVTGTEEINGVETKILEAFVEDNSIQKEYYELSDKGLIAHKRYMSAAGQELVLNPPEMMLKFPLKVGDSWTWSGDIDGQPAGNYTFTVEAEEEVTVPAGTFMAYKVKLVGKAASEETEETEATETTEEGTEAVEEETTEEEEVMVESTRWFVKDIGMVKENSKAGPITVVAELKSAVIGGKTIPEGAEVTETTTEEKPVETPADEGAEKPVETPADEGAGKPE
ncbi:MAG: hypothetical protein ACLFQV_10810 [Vulcanimicrobiota bacterium]